MTIDTRATLSIRSRSRLLAVDLLRVGSVGVRTRKLRAVLSGLGIAMGIASIVGVLGISQSSKADLLQQLDRLGTNLLTVTPGQTLQGRDARLPVSAVAAVSRIGPVQTATSVTATEATARRSRHVDPRETNGLSVEAVDLNTLDTLDGAVAAGRFLDRATASVPAAVLGAKAAERLGITHLSHTPLVWIGERYYGVVGILAPLTLAPELDRAVLIGRPIAERLLAADTAPTRIYLRSVPEAVVDVRGVLAASVNPQHPEEVNVSRPSDALAARAAASGAFTSLLLGLGAVALLVGGVGIANVMVISVLERRSEIGLRRALGATRRHVAAQFLTESLLLSFLGGAAGVALGTAVVTAYALTRGWTVVIPGAGLLLGLLSAVGIGAVAGLYPAVRASRLAPTVALRTV